MKNSVQNTLLFGLALPLAVSASPKKAAPKQGAGSSSVQGGNNQQTIYEFKNDRFGAGDTINLSSNQQAAGGQTAQKGARKLRRDLLNQLYVRSDPTDGESSHGKDTFSSGGNDLHLKISSDDSAPGGFSIKHFSSQSGGDVVGGQGGANFNSGSSSVSIFGRDAAPEPIFNGGKAKGGSSTTKGGNNFESKNSANGAKTGPGGQINMQTQANQQGGNTMGAAGGANYGSGGAGGSAGASLAMPFFKRDLESTEGLMRLVARYAAAEAEADALAEAEAEAEALAEAEAEAFFDGGSTKGGDSTTNGGNNFSSSNSANHAKTGKGGQMNFQTQANQQGGNTKGARGGSNFGSGGAGGSASAMFSMPFPMVKRGLDAGADYDSLVRLVARYAEAEAEADAEAEAFFDGGSSSGGSSTTNGGNNFKSSNSANHAKTGKGGQMNFQTQANQQGGNTKGAMGGANFGSGGSGGAFSAGLSLFPKRDVDGLVHLYERYAYPEPEAEAEAEFEFDEYDF